VLAGLELTLLGHSRNPTIAASLALVLRRMLFDDRRHVCDPQSLQTSTHDGDLTLSAVGAWLHFVQERKLSERLLWADIVAEVI
jgi:hypothetical protein